MARWNDLGAIFQEMELQLIASMKRNLKKHEAEEEKLGFTWEQWQNAKLREIERFRKENRKIVKEFSPSIEKTIKSSIETSFKRGWDKVTEFISKAKIRLFGTKNTIPRKEEIKPKKELNAVDLEVEVSMPEPMRATIDTEIFQKPDPSPEDKKKILEFREQPEEEEKHFFKTNEGKISEIIKEAEEAVKEPQKAVLRYMDDQYKHILYKIIIKMNMGGITIDQAIDEAVRDFLAAGIANIEYSDGKKVNIASYAEMVLRTSSHKAFLKGQGEVRKKLGISKVLVSQHASACKYCVPWQNKILIDDVFSDGKPDGVTPTVSEAMKAGLIHVNCQHNLNTYIEGISIKPPDVDNTEALERYKKQQQQRAIEREIRKTKREIAGLLDKEEVRFKKEKLKDLNAKMMKLLAKDKRLARRPNREKDRFKGKGV